MHIYKYEIETLKFTLNLPIGAVILDVQVQKGNPFMWVRVNTENKKEERSFEIIGTGHEFDENGKVYIKTFQHGPLVWHLHEVH